MDRYLADCGVATRSELKEMIRKGRVMVDESIVREPGFQVKPGENLVSVDRVPVLWQKRLVYLMNKPAGIITATEDPRMETVLDLLPETVRRMGLFPIGRLDRDTEGLLLLTNDGHLAHGLLAPKKHVDKLYEAVLDCEPELGAEEIFLKGVLLADGTRCRPAVLERRPAVLELRPYYVPPEVEDDMSDPVVEEDPSLAPEAEYTEAESTEAESTEAESTEAESTEAESTEQEKGEKAPHGAGRICPVARVTIVEGKFHQVKRMFLAVGSRVLFLKRLRMGPVSLGDDLAPGGFRPLSKDEIEQLVLQAGLDV